MDYFLIGYALEINYFLDQLPTRHIMEKNYFGQTVNKLM